MVSVEQPAWSQLQLKTEHEWWTDKDFQLILGNRYTVDVSSQKAGISKGV